MHAHAQSPRRLLATVLVLLLVFIFIHHSGIGRRRQTMAQPAQEILDRLKTLSPVQQRRAAAILGAVVADAASMCVPAGCIFFNATSAYLRACIHSPILHTHTCTHPSPPQRRI